MRDDDDTYLVVAADKGTATFSDTANRDLARVRLLARRRVRLRRLGRLRPQEARDHRARRVGVGQAPLPRARGRHRGRRVHRRRHRRHVRRRVRQRDAAVATRSGWSPPTTTGTSSSTPTRTPAASFAERRRLFELPGSSWDDYDRELISEGGGVLPRTREVDPAVAAGARGARASTTSALAPTEVIRAILRAPVDLLWNGGIGTVVKASTETDADAADRSSDAIRVDARRAARAGRGGGRQPRLHAPRARRVLAPAAGASTPTSSTTRPASTAPTTRST